MHFTCQRNLPCLQKIPLILLLLALSSILCRGCDGRWLSTSTKKIAFDRHDHVMSKQIKLIPRGGDNSGSGGDNDDILKNPDDSEPLSPSSSFEILDEKTVYSESSSFEILDEKTVYSGWRTILQRTIRMRNGKVVDFDLVGVKTGEGAVMIFAWDTKSKTATMIREYMPASHRILWGLAAGLIEDKQDTIPNWRHATNLRRSVI